MNVPGENAPTEIPAYTSKLSQSNNYYLLENIYSILQENYLRGQKFNQAELIYGAAEWLVNELGDQHTKFFRPDASTDFKNSLDGNIVGIGVVIDVDATGSLSVTDVIRHSPADKAWIIGWDKIIKVDNIPVSTEDGIVDDIARLRGKVQTQVEVTVQSGKITKTVAIVREIIHIEQVEVEELSHAYHIIFWEVAFGVDAASWRVHFRDLSRVVKSGSSSISAIILEVLWQRLEVSSIFGSISEIPSSSSNTQNSKYWIMHWMIHWLIGR
jgi:C-terminal processing protease CtpA/Prc